MKIGLISDTHGLLRPGVFDALAEVELILHAGDVGGENILTELGTLAPVHAVLGNTDAFPLAGSLREVETLELAGRTVVLTHGHRLGSPTPERLRAAHPDARIIVYGHTHQPRVERVEGILTVNPGAAGPTRFKLRPSVAILELTETGEQVTPIDL